MEFLDFGLLDFIDILLVAFLLFQLYRLVKGTVAINIFIGVTAIYLIWKMTEALQMELLSEILGQFIGVGVIALIIVFQQEIRKFLLLIGTSGFNGRFSLSGLFKKVKEKKAFLLSVEDVVEACQNMSSEKTGAIIVITRRSKLGFVSQSGDRIDADVSKRLIESVFNKTSPLHDGAMILEGNRIIAARCVLPVIDDKDLPPHFGLRHRAAMGITDQSDALAIVVSEETGKISYAKEGEILPNLDPFELREQLEKDLS
jgi:uncharacterized protein (TIGR00159 family)